MTFREAAVLPIAYLSAYILLFEIGNIKPGQKLLFHSAGGGVGGKLDLFLSILYNIKKELYEGKKILIGLFFLNSGFNTTVKISA